jgi:hypothetical protein
VLETAAEIPVLSVTSGTACRPFSIALELPGEQRHHRRDIGLCRLFVGRLGRP